MEMSRQFLARGGAYPRGCPDGPSLLRTECLIEGTDPHLEANLRFGQAIERQVLDAEGEPVDELVVTGHRYTSGEEMVQRDVQLSSLPGRTAAVRAAACERAELSENSALAGTLVWRWEPLHATVEAWTEELGPGLRRVRIDVANRLECDDGPEGRARRRTLHATHLLLHSPDGAFASLAHPPAHLREHAIACCNEGLWPVPLGEAGDRRTVLAAPVHLEDYPHVALEPNGPRLAALR